MEPSKNHSNRINQQVWYQKNKEKAKEKKKSWYERNREYALAKNREWRLKKVLQGQNMKQQYICQER